MRDSERVVEAAADAEDREFYRARSGFEEDADQAKRFRQRMARLHDEENRAEFEIRRRERAMEAEERELIRAMRAFEEDADQAKRSIKAEWRREHWGHDPDRPPAWERS